MKVSVKDLINDVVNDEMKDVQSIIVDKEAIVKDFYDVSVNGGILDEYEIRDNADSFDSRYTEVYEEISRALDDNPDKLLDWLKAIDQDLDKQLEIKIQQLTKDISRYASTKKTISKIMDLNSIKRKAMERGSNSKSKDLNRSKTKNQNIDR